MISCTSLNLPFDKPVLSEVEGLRANGRMIKIVDLVAVRGDRELVERSNHPRYFC